MDGSLNYSLSHSTATVEIALAGARFFVKTCGRGLADRPKTIDIAVSDLQYFALVPTIGAQNTAARVGQENITDQSYDSEFIFSYRLDGKLKTKRMFVNGRDPIFAGLLAELKALRPDASLLHLDPAAAQKQIGVMSAKKGMLIVIGVIIGIPIIIAVIMIVSAIFGR